jgi:hypothetical protein
VSFISNYAAVSLTSSASLIVVANNQRKGILIVNNGAGTAYFGMDVNVTTSNGLPITANGSLNLTGLYDAWRGNIYGISASTSDIRFWEWGL